MHTKINEYLCSVCNQIRWKKTHDIISQELEDHIADQKNTFTEDGIDEDTAVEMAVKEMGDPVDVGQRLDRIHRPKPNWGILWLTAFIVMLGGVLHYFISLTESDYGYMFTRYLMYIPIGAAVLFGVYFIDYSILGRYPKIIFCVIAAAGLCYSFIRYRVDAVFIDRVYYITLLLIPNFASIVYNQRRKGYKGILICLIYYFTSIFICIIGSSRSGLIQIEIAYTIILIIAISKNWFHAKKITALILTGIPIIFQFFGNLLTSGFFIFDSLISRYNYISLLKNCVFWGETDLGAKYDLSSSHNKHTSNMFLYLTQKYGYALVLFVVSVLLIMIIKMLIVSCKQKSELGFIISISTTLVITLQMVFYILYNLGFSNFPNDFPLLSFGGMGFSANMALIGLFLSVCRYNNLLSDKYIARLRERKKAKAFSDSKVSINSSM